VLGKKGVQMKKILLLSCLALSILFVGCPSKTTVQPSGEAPKFNTDTSTGLYQEGQYYLKHKNYDYAQRSFSTLVEGFPEDSLAAYAQFMVAEILSNSRNPNMDLKSAIDEYQTLLKDYPNSKYVAKAQKKITEIEKKLEKSK
jgi:outer membrane protein assembly factor BamD (BamD/ComL family)